MLRQGQPTLVDDDGGSPDPSLHQAFLTRPRPATFCWTFGSPTYDTKPTPPISTARSSVAWTLARPAPAMLTRADSATNDSPEKLPVPRMTMSCVFAVPAALTFPAPAISIRQAPRFWLVRRTSPAPSTLIAS